MVYVLRLIDNTLVSHPGGLLCQIQAKNNVEHLMSGTNSSLNAARAVLVMNSGAYVTASKSILYTVRSSDFVRRLMLYQSRCETRMMKYIDDIQPPKEYIPSVAPHLDNSHTIEINLGRANIRISNTVDPVVLSETLKILGGLT